MNIMRQYGLTLDPISNQVTRCNAPDLEVSEIGHDHAASHPAGEWLVQVAHTTNMTLATANASDADWSTLTQMLLSYRSANSSPKLTPSLSP